MLWPAKQDCSLFRAVHANAGTSLEHETIDLDFEGANNA